MNPPAALDQATAVAQSAAELAQIPWDQLEASIAPEVAHAIAQARSFLDAAMVGIAARLEQTGAAEQQGWSSTKDFLTHITGGHKGTGGGLVRAAQQLEALPAVAEALNNGTITLPQARAIGSKITTLPRAADYRTAVADRILELVHTQGYDASDILASFTEVAREVDPIGEFLDTDQQKAREERGAHGCRYLAIAPDHLGGANLRGYCTLEDAERLKTSLMPLAAPVTTEPGACGGIRRRPDEPILDENGHQTGTTCPTPGCAHDGRDPREHGARMLDALIELTHRAAAADNLPRAHGTTARILVTIDHDSLRHTLIDAGLARSGEMSSGQRLSARAVRLLACDAEIIPAVLGTQGQILDVGRTQRLVTTALWFALLLRDKHCAFPGCTALPIACDAHHIVHWADGGTTSLENLILVCRRHHTALHNTPWTVHIDPDTGQPAWTAPPKIDVRDRFTYRRARTAEEIAAAYRSPPPGREPDDRPHHAA